MFLVTLWPLFKPTTFFSQIDIGVYNEFGKTLWDCWLLNMIISKINYKKNFKRFESNLCFTKLQISLHSLDWKWISLNWWMGQILMDISDVLSKSKIIFSLSNI